MPGTLDTALLKADVYPVKGREVFWLIVRGQLEHIVSDIAVSRVPLAQKYISGVSIWQGLAVPVINLERYFNFKAVQGKSSGKRLLVKTAVQNTENVAARLFIDIPHDIRMRSIGTDCVHARISG